MDLKLSKSGSKSSKTGLLSWLINTGRVIVSKLSSLMSAKMGDITQFAGGMISTVEKKRNLNVLRNKHHFKESDAELQSMKDTLKAQSQYKKRDYGSREEQERGQQEWVYKSNEVFHIWNKIFLNMYVLVDSKINLIVQVHRWLPKQLQQSIGNC